MWKWILGILAVIGIVVIGGAYFGYKKVTAAGDTLTMTVGGSQEHVFALLATPDSMAAWVESAKVTRPLGQGMLRVGDTLVLDDPGRQIGGTRQNMDWVVREISPPNILALEMRSDTGKVTGSMMTRRDSLVSQGDSTIIVSTFATPFMDSLGTAVKDSSKVGSALMGGASKMMVGALRLVYENDLTRLKAHVEGKP